jgi:hypothetical protein
MVISGFSLHDDKFQASIAVIAIDDEMTILQNLLGKILASFERVPRIIVFQVKPVGLGENGESSDGSCGSGKRKGMILNELLQVINLVLHDSPSLGKK